MKLLPDGFRVLLAPAAPPPALRLGLALGEVPADPVVPPIEDPVVTPLVADPPAAPPAAEPVPVCAKATLLVTAKAAANPMLVSLMMVFPFAVITHKPASAGMRSWIRASNESNEA